MKLQDVLITMSVMWGPTTRILDLHTMLTIYVSVAEEQRPGVHLAEDASESRNSRKIS
jgi:hypothetical protein